MKVKIAIIGAGGVIFSRRLIADILLDPILCESEIALMDINAERLEHARIIGEKVAKKLGIPAHFSVWTDLTGAVSGAGFVLTIFRVGSLEHSRFEYEIPKKYGVDQVVGDSMCPGGIFRGLRTLKALFEVLDAVERYAPGAYLLNYVNPMSANTIALSRRSKTVKVVGLCHSVRNTLQDLSGRLGIDPKNVHWLCAGVNHQAFFLKLESGGRDLYPALEKWIDDPAHAKCDRVRGEIFRHFGYFPTESSGHNSEYNPYFRKRPDLIERYCSHTPPECGGFDWGAMGDGESGASLKIVPGMQMENEAQTARLLSGAEDLEISSSGEYAIEVISAIVGNHPLSANLNVMNHGLIPNLPPECAVEVPCLVDGGGIHPCRVENYPEQLAGLNRMMINAQILTAEGALECNRRKIVWAMSLDPLTAAVCSLEEVRSMAGEMFDALADQIEPAFFKKCDARF